MNFLSCTGGFAVRAATDFAADVSGLCISACVSLHQGALCIVSLFRKNGGVRTLPVPPSIVDRGCMSVYGQQVARFCG